MRFLTVAALGLLAGCGGQGGTVGHNYSEPPPNAEIVATPRPTPTAEVPNLVEEDEAVTNIGEADEMSNDVAD